MVFWQPKKLKDLTTQTVGGSTDWIDLTETGNIGSLMLYGSASRGTVDVTDRNWRILDFISKVELMMNGSTPILALSGRQLAADAWFDQKVVNPDVAREYGAATNYWRAIVNFGRYLFDRKYGLVADDKHYFQLRITNNMTSTTWGSTSLAYSIYEMFKRDDSPFTGHIRKESFKQWTTVQDAWEYTNLPTEGMIKRIMLQCIPAQHSTEYHDKCTTWDLADDINYTFNSGAVECFRGHFRDLLHMNFWDYQNELLAHMTQYYHTTAGRAAFWGGAYPLAVGANLQDKENAGGTTSINFADDTESSMRATAYTAGYPLTALIKGLGVEGCAVLRHDREPDLSDMLNPEARKVVKLDVHSRNSSSAAGGTNYIILNRVYPTPT